MCNKYIGFKEPSVLENGLTWSGHANKINIIIITNGMAVSIKMPITIDWT